MAHRPNRDLATAPVSHQKRPHQNATNAIERTRNRSKINEAVRCTAAHYGLVAGSSSAGPAMRSTAFKGPVWPERITTLNRPRVFGPLRRGVGLQESTDLSRAEHRRSCVN